MSRYKVLVYTPLELSQSSYFLTGLFMLAEEGKLQIEVKQDFKLKKGRLIVADHKVKKVNKPFPKAAYFKLIDIKNQTSISFATDTYDFDNQFSAYALKHCDFVFKRNYLQKNIDFLPLNKRAKMYKMGLTFKVYSDLFRKNKTLQLGFLIVNLKADFKIDRHSLSRLYKSFKKHKKQIKLLKNARLIEQYNKVKKGDENIVFFQTRCFSEEYHEDVRRIHEQRYHIIKLLKKEFPKYFRGGFIPSKIVNNRFADAITDVPTEAHAYLEALKNAKIVIYTRGLANSPAWKMAEYLSQGKVIIAERLTTNLPFELEHGKHLLFFQNDQELIENISLVLNNLDLAEKLSRNARLYYENYVHPRENAKRILELMTPTKL
ncbi:glycosyltransferase [Haloflavibacter putidus]|uniref:Glycosyltransferase family 1 protein n=1 Tax=Haloflavibacter putidus TaxID=2576776 RepID=A0A507ZFZ3_9FLAO|nr:glycosyltransferase [Haloflavibacter putidus]TQD33815.1 glycosyltransferase family 1 protein [Haloflavibacter putidus]